jgi:hypothetical protein
MSLGYPAVTFKISGLTRLLNMDSMTKKKGDVARADGTAPGNEDGTCGGSEPPMGP